MIVCGSRKGSAVGCAFGLMLVVSGCMGPIKSSVSLDFDRGKKAEALPKVAPDSLTNASPIADAPQTTIPALAPAAAPTGKGQIEDPTPSLKQPPANPSRIVHEGGIVFVAKRALLKDRADGFQIIGSKLSSYRSQALLQGIILSERQGPDMSWNYFVLGSPTNFLVLKSTTRNRATATGSVDIPDQDIIELFKLSLIATESTPPEAPSGTSAHRLQVEFVKSTLPFRGNAQVRRIFFPGIAGAKDRDWRKITTSLDLQFDLPGISSLNGQPFVFKKIESNFLSNPQGDDLPFLEDEQQVWPDGMVLQQVLTRRPDLSGFSVKGTMILPDEKRTPINFERTVDLAGDTAASVIRTLDGIVIELHYGAKRVFSKGQVRVALGGHLAEIRAIRANEAWLVFPDGATESIHID